MAGENATPLRITVDFGLDRVGACLFCDICCRTISDDGLDVGFASSLPSHPRWLI